MQCHDGVVSVREEVHEMTIINFVPKIMKAQVVGWKPQEHFETLFSDEFIGMVFCIKICDGWWLYNKSNLTKAARWWISAQKSPNHWVQHGRCQSLNQAFYQQSLWIAVQKIKLDCLGITKADCLPHRQSMAYAVWQTLNTTIQNLQTKCWCSTEHQFNNHKDCDEKWCWVKGKSEEEENGPILS